MIGKNTKTCALPAAVLESARGLRPFSLLATLCWVLQTSPGLADSSAGTGGLQDNYNSAASSQKNGANAEMVTGAVYSAASAVCVANCLTEYFEGTAPCSASTMGAGASDAAASQQLAGFISQLPGSASLARDGWKEFGGSSESGSAQGTQGAGNSAAQSGGQGGGAGGSQAGNTASSGNGANGQGGQAGKKGESSGKSEACFMGAVDALQSMMKYAGGKKQDEAANQNLASAKSVANNDRSYYHFQPASSKGGSAPGAAGMSAATSGNPITGNTPGSNSASQNCAQARATGNFASAVACAAATDPNLPPMVMNPGFPAALQQMTGMSPSDFIKKTLDQGPGKSIGDAVGQGAGLNAEGGARARALFAALEKKYDEYGGYTGGGGGRGGRGSRSAEPDFSQMLQGMMAQLNPQKEPTDTAANTQLLNNAKGDRSPANIAEDRRISLFDRITLRYRTLSPRILF